MAKLVFLFEICKSCRFIRIFVFSLKLFEFLVSRHKIWNSARIFFFSRLNCLIYICEIFVHIFVFRLTNNLKFGSNIFLFEIKLFTFFFIFQRHRKDVGNFDRQFTSEKTDLTPTDKLFMMNLDQNEFAGFSFLNPEYVQHV